MEVIIISIMVNYIAIEVPELYPYVLLFAGAIAFQCLSLGFVAGSKRSTIFSQEYMEQFNN